METAGGSQVLPDQILDYANAVLKDDRLPFHMQNRLFIMTITCVSDDDLGLAECTPGLIVKASCPLHHTMGSDAYQIRGEERTP